MVEIPETIWKEIYEWDPTYTRDMYTACISELEQYIVRFMIHRFDRLARYPHLDVMSSKRNSFGIRDKALYCTVLFWHEPTSLHFCVVNDMTGASVTYRETIHSWSTYFHQFCFSSMRSQGLIFSNP